jgi:hypothetical protein
MAYVPLAAVFAATRKSETRPAGARCGEGIGSWVQEDLARLLNNGSNNSRGSTAAGTAGASDEADAPATVAPPGCTSSGAVEGPLSAQEPPAVDSPRSAGVPSNGGSGAVDDDEFDVPGATDPEASEAATTDTAPVREEVQAIQPRTRMASVFVAQLPFDMQLDALQALADEVVPGPSVRIVFAAPHLRNRRSYDGCAFLRMPDADAHRFVAALHKRVLFDVDGAWYATTTEQQAALQQYCAWVQEKPAEERRRLLPRPTPFAALTAEFALKSGSRLMRSRNMRM